MKEGIEKLKKEEEEKSPIEKLKEIKEKDDFIKKEDSLHPTPLHAIDLDNLDPGALELYRLYDEGDIDSARAGIRLIGEKIEKIKDKKKRENNEKLLNYVDNLIGEKFLKEKLEQDQSLIE